ncbi:MAG TPA: hypothetical protein VK607_17495 [Kofleriaceae bacterium]|nr:hypothetical protein [Kofleriaceae bacterium]
MRFALALAIAIGIAAPARADTDDDGIRGSDKGNFGVGIILGEPTGITAKLYLRDDRAIQAAVGSAFIGGGLQIHADYLFHPYILQSRPSYVLPFYIGPGVRLIDYTTGRDDANGNSNSAFAFGPRGVVGLLFDFKNVPLDAFIEVAGVLEYEFRDGAGFGIKLNAGAGVRYYF